MKNFIKKLEKRVILLLLVLFVSSYATVTNAQIVSSTPTISSKAVIHYQGYSKLWMKLSGVQNGQSVTIRSFSGQYNNSVTITNGEVLTLIPEGEDFEVVTTDAIGAEVTLSRIKSYPDEMGGDMIEVSDELYAAIRQFQTMDNPPSLNDYLAASNYINKYEKTAFIQKFLLDGMKLIIDDDNVPDLSIYPTVSWKDNCQCKFIHVSTQNVSVGTVSALDGSITAAKDPEIFPGHEEYNNDSDRYWWRSTKGPAKSHHLYSGGFHAGGTQRSGDGYRVDNSQQLSSPHKARLAYTLLCVGSPSLLPEGCDCTKTMTLYWKYDTKVTTRAELRGGWRSKNAEAFCEDMALVTLTIEGEYEILDAIDVRSDSRCEREPNDEFWVNMTDIVASVALIFMQDDASDPSAYAALINEIANSLGELITTDFWETNGCDDNGSSLGTIEGERTIEFHPNDKIVLELLSFTNQTVGGKRSWHAMADISSDFYIASVVDEGSPTTGTDACCGNRYGNWVYASEGGGSFEETYLAPLSQEEIADWLGTMFGDYGNWENLERNPFSGALVLPSEVGYTEHSVDCNKIGRITNDFEGDILQERIPYAMNKSASKKGLHEKLNKEGKIRKEGSELKEEKEKSKNKSLGQDDKVGLISHITVFDVMGRILFNEKTSFSREKLKSFIIDKNIISHTGIYFVQAKLDTGKSFTEKVFITY